MPCQTEIRLTCLWVCVVVAGVGGGKRHAVGDLIYFFVYYGKLLLKGPKIVQVREEKKSPECPILSRDQSYL